MSTTWLTPEGVTSTLAGVLDAHDDHQGALHLTYLRRKPGRGLVAVYGQPSDPGHLFTLTVEEQAMATAQEAPQPSAWRGHWPGMLEVAGRGLTLQSFPYDVGLPALAAAMTPMQTPALRAALEQAVRPTLPVGETWRLEEVEATALRYKPGDRCVIRYRLRLVATEPASQRVEHVTRSVVGKVYRDVTQAREAAALLERLAASPQSPRWSPDSLGVVEPLPLALSQDLGSPGDVPPTVPGTTVIRPADA
ncbi:MAG: hypothetical protein ACTHJ6_02400, partial [Oryzihumus sp.]